MHLNAKGTAAGTPFLRPTLKISVQSGTDKSVRSSQTFLRRAGVLVKKV